MTRILPLLLLLACTSGCYSTVTPGEVVIGVNVATQDDSQRYTVIRGGRYWASINWDYYNLPVTEQRAVWTKDTHEGALNDESLTFAGKDGQPVNIDLGVGYQIASDDKSVIEMVRRYGLNVNTVIHGRVRDSTRNALNLCADEFTVEDIYGEKKTDLMSCTEKMVQDEYGKNGLTITRLTLNSEVRLPQKVKDALEASIAASQEADRTHRQIDQTKAEGEKTVAKAVADAEAMRVATEAQANANLTLARSLTPELIQLKELQVQQATVEKWNGQLPAQMVGGQVPFVQVSK